MNKTENIIFLLGAILMVAGSALLVLLNWLPSVWLYTIGSLAFAGIQIMDGYDGQNKNVKRLRKIQVIGDVLFVVAALFMIQDKYFLVHIEWNYYVEYIHNNWVVILLVAAILELYTTHRISHEIEKEAKKL